MFNRAAWCIGAVLSLPAAAIGQTATMNPAVAASSASAPVIRRDTPVHLMVMSEVSTKDRGVGYRFKLRVDKPVTSGGAIVIPVGTIAYGEVTSATTSGNLGKSGKLGARLLHIDLAGTLIPLTGETQSFGKNGTGETIVGVLALGPLGLFAKGNNAKIKAGELMTGFVAVDTPLPLPQ